MKPALLFASLILLCCIGCQPKDPNKQIDEGKIQGQLYESKEIGWKIEIPNGWDVVTKDETEARDKKGRDAIESSNNIKVDMSGLKNLVSFKKNQFNLFVSMSEPFKEDAPGAYEQKNADVYKLMYDTYVAKGIKADTASGKETIAGLDFYKFSSTIYGSDGKVILQQLMYSRLINGYDFSVNINYNNDADRDELLNTFRHSTFK